MGYNDMFRVGAHAVITNPDGHILLLKSTYGNKSWGLPGGALDPGETVYEAVVRECHEELGLVVNVLYLSGIYFHQEYHSHSCVFRCELPQAGKIVLSEEHSEYRYVPFSELSVIQQHRIQDCLLFEGLVKSARF